MTSDANQFSERLITRRMFLRAGAVTLGGAALASLPGCGGETSFFPGGVDEYTLRVAYAENDLAGTRIRTRTYNGSIPGPLMHTAPGRRLRITVVNDLPPNPPGQESNGGGGGGHGHGASSRAPGGNINNPHDFNTTNLHVHGIQVAPHLFQPFGTSNPSSPMLAIEPGQRYTYNFDVPTDQPPGLYWYHPHHHGSTFLQVANGMAGAIVVHGAIDEVPEIKAARDVILAVQIVRVDPKAGEPNLWVNDPIEGLPSDQGGLSGSNTKNFFVVNGRAVAWIGPQQSAPTNPLSVDTLTMQPGEVVRFRVLNGLDELILPVTMDGHSLHMIGIDGINLLETTEMPSLELPPGGRCEFLIKAGAPGSYMLKMGPVTGQQFSDTQGCNLLNVVVQGPPIDMPLPTSLPTPSREYPLIADSEIVATRTLHFATKFPFPELIAGVGFQINDLSYATERIDATVRRGTAEEWLLTATADEAHPFHLHVNSFQVVEVNGQPLDPPIFRDVVTIPRGGSVKIRVRFKQWVGKSVYHCHILFHEDLGMMQNFMIAR